MKKKPSPNWEPAWFDPSTRAERHAKLEQLLAQRKLADIRYEQALIQRQKENEARRLQEARIEHERLKKRLGDRYREMTPEERAADIERIAKRDAEEERQKHIARYLAMVPELYADASFDNYLCEDDKERNNVEVCRAYADTFSDIARKNNVGMIMYGDTGAGKTHLCFAIYKAVVMQGFTVIYESAIRMLSKMRNYKEDNEGWIRRYETCDLLIIDEMCRQDDGEHARDTLFRVLDERAMWKRPIVCVSNFDEQTVKSYMTEPGFFRVLNGGISLYFSGRNRRDR